jgi:hypothetical protein
MRLVNCFAERTTENEFNIVKRPGMSEDRDYSPASNTGRGVYSWEGDLYAIWGDKVYKAGSALTGTLAGSTGRCYFDETGGATPKLIIQDADAGELYSVTTGGTLANLSDTDVPTTQAPGVVVFDQYVCVMDSSVAQIWNSDAGDETTWGSTSFLTAETLADDGVRLARHANYLVAFGKKSIEFFFDENNATGSPFGRLEGTVSLIGCPEGATVQNIDDELLFVAESHHGGRYVAKLRGFTPEPVSSKVVEESLDKEGSNISNAYAFAVRSMGHSFYVLTLPTTAAKTWVFDLTDGVWHEWTYYNGSTESYFTGMASTTHAGEVIIQDEDNGKTYVFDPAVYQDDTQTIKLLGITPLFDYDTMQNKFMSRLIVVGDEATATGNLSIQWTDDDYITYNTARTVDLASSSPQLTRCGKFKRRAFKYAWENNLPLRLRAFEANVRMGHYGQ